MMCGRDAMPTAVVSVLVPLLSILADGVVGQQAHTCTEDKLAGNSSTPWRKDEFPNPTTDPGACGRGKKRTKPTWICDPDGIISRQQADDLDELLAELRQNHTCEDVCTECTEGSSDYGGFPMAIAFVNKIHSDKELLSELDKLKATERFARYLRETAWGYGQCENDAVIVLAIGNRKQWTSIGTKFNERISDWCLNHIYKDIRHQLWAGNYSEAIASMIISYGDVLQGQMKCEEGVRVGSIIFMLAMCSFGMCAVISFISFFKQRFKLCEDGPVKV